jgi:integrase
MATYRKRADKWEFTLYTGNLTHEGKRERIYRGGFKTKKEAERVAASLMTELERGTYFKVDKMTFQVYIGRFMESIKPNLAYKTYVTYEYIVNKHLIPHFGYMELSKIKPINIQEFYTKSLESVSSTTVKHFHNFLNKAFKQAMKWQLINNNPTNSVEPPRRDKKQMLVYDDEQLFKLLDKIKHMTIYWPVMLAATTGMREGEICGLLWDNVDLDNGIIYVKKQLQGINNSLQLVPLKTNSSNRKIILLDFSIQELKRLKLEQEENKKEYKEYYQENRFVVAQKETGLPYDPEYISRNYGRVLKEYKHKVVVDGETKSLSLCEELQIPYIRFHDLRHTHATLMLKANIHPKIVAERLGHSSVNLTLNTYSHLLPDMQKEAVDKLNDMFNKSDT